ncbi:hypothetical protein BH24CHL5_BH24CHL5_05960 [soil metagenome]
MADESDFTTAPRWLHGFDLGLLAGLGMAALYGFLAEPVGLTWGLAAVGFIGGVVVGGAVMRGAWAGRPHPRSRRLRLMALAIAVGSWILGVFLAYAISQALLPQASTSVFERISLAGFSAYFGGLFDMVRLSHAAALAAMAFMAFRGTR